MVKSSILAKLGEQFAVAFTFFAEEIELLLFIAEKVKQNRINHTVYKYQATYYSLVLSLMYLVLVCL